MKKNYQPNIPFKIEVNVTITYGLHVTTGCYMGLQVTIGY